jgi:hypothetical protein
VRPNIVTVNVDPATWQRLTNYAHFMGLSYTRAANDALAEWLDTFGESIIDTAEMNRRPRTVRDRDNVVVIGQPQ